LDRRLGWPQSRSGCCGEEKNIELPGIELGPFSPSLYRLSYLIRGYDYKIFYPENRRNRCTRNVGAYLPKYDITFWNIIIFCFLNRLYAPDPITLTSPTISI
jgi:hypothetical protein